jgi:D-alanyl-D-alanine dipeptidase
MKKTIIFLIAALAVLLMSCNSEVSNPVTPSPTVSATATPTAAPTPTPTPEPTPEPTPTPCVKLSDPTSSLSVRKGPGTNTEKLGSLNDGDPVTILEQGDVWHKISYNGGEAYVFAAYITNVPVYYAYVPALTATYDGKTYISDMVDVRYICPGIKIWLTFASQDNVLHKKFYPAGACLLQRSTAEKLKAANDLFMEDGYRIRLYDGYRPYSVTVEFYELVHDGRFVQNPKHGPSNHNRGAAVDITLERIDTGEQIPMYSFMHTFNISSLRNLPDITQYEEGTEEYNDIIEEYGTEILKYGKRSAKAKRNVDYLTRTMKKCGFTTINSEWWHFNDKEKGKFMVLDYDLAADVQWIPAEEYEAFLAEKAAEGPLTTLPDYVVYPKPGTEEGVTDVE